MKQACQVAAVLLALGLAAAPAVAQKPQGRPGGPDRPAAAGARGGGGSAPAKAARPQGRGNSGKAAQAQGQGQGKSSRAQQAKRQAQAARDRLPPAIRQVSGSSRAGAFVTGAVAYGVVRGLDADALRLRQSGERLVVHNRDNELLFDMDEDRARRIGVWNLRLLGDQQPAENAPAFCRSGAGHPVWGREWCLDKGFGLGRSNDRLWSRTQPEDIIFGRRIERDRLDRGSLIDVLGDVVFGRLALHALALGFDRPLVGYYVAESEAPQILRIHAGPEPVAEMIDLDRDGRVDVLYVTHHD